MEECQVGPVAAGLKMVPGERNMGWKGLVLVAEYLENTSNRSAD